MKVSVFHCAYTT